MAVVLTDFAPYKLTNDATPGDATKVTFPSGTVAVDIISEADGAQFSNTGTDGEALGDNFFQINETMVPYRLYLPPEVYNNPPVVYFGHDDTVGVIRLLPLFSRFPAGV